MVGARSAAMAFNRLVDAGIDAAILARGCGICRRACFLKASRWGFRGRRRLRVSPGCRHALNPLCFRLAPLALALVFFYSFTKRFTSLSHLVLGFALGIAPAAAWIAIRGSFDPRILWLTAAVTFWTAGFDIIYACQDYEFDRVKDSSACPAIGYRGCAVVSRLLHVAMMVCLLVLVRALRSRGR